MSTHLEDIFNRSYSTFFNGFGNLFRGLEPKVKKFETEVRNEFQKYQGVLSRISSPNLNKKFVKLNYNLPINPQQTIVKVGNASLNVRGSFPIFQRFLQSLIEHEAKQAKASVSEIDGSSETGRHSRLTGALIKTKAVVDEACSSLQTIKNFSNEIQNYKNRLLLQTQTPQLTDELERIDEMLAKLQSLALPLELDASAVEAFSKNTESIIAELRHQFDNMQSPPADLIRKNVADIQTVGLAALTSSRETHQLFDSVLETISTLKAHLFRLGQYKELLFKQDLSRFTTFEDLRDTMKRAQELQEIVKQMELEVLILMDRNPTSQNIQKEQVEVYKQDAEQLIAKQENLLSTLNDRANRLNLPQKPLGLTDAPTPNQSITLITFSPEITSFHQKRDSLIDEQKKQFKINIHALLAIGEEKNEIDPLVELVEDLISVREQSWNELNVEGQACSTEQEVEQWYAKFNTFKAIEEQIYNQLEQDIKQGVIGGHIEQAKNVIEQIRIAGYGCSKINFKKDNKRCPALQQFPALIKNPKLTFAELKNLIYSTNASIIQWSAEQNLSKDMLTSWTTAFQQLTVKIGAAEVFLQADAKHNQAYLDTLTYEQERFRYFKDLYVVKKYEEMIKQMNSIHLFSLAADPLNTLSQYVSKWNEQLLIVEQDRQSLFELGTAEEKFDESFKLAETQIDIWKETYQHQLANQLHKLINAQQNSLDNRKSLLRNSTQIELLTQVLKENTQAIQNFINTSVEIPLPDLMESCQKANPGLALDIGNYYFKKLTDKTEQFKNLLGQIRHNLSNEISSTQASMGQLEEKIKQAKFNKDPQDQAEFENQSKCLFVLQDLKDIIDLHENRMTNIKKSAEIIQITPAKLREYEEEVVKFVIKAKKDIQERIDKAPFVPFLQNHTIDLD